MAAFVVGKSLAISLQPKHFGVILSGMRACSDQAEFRSANFARDVKDSWGLLSRRLGLLESVVALRRR